MRQTISTATDMFSALSILPDLTIPPDKSDEPIKSMEQCRTPPTLPSFCHAPPPGVQGRDRWPSSLEAQICPSVSPATLDDVLILVSPYLTSTDRAKTACTSTVYSLGPEYGPLWFSRPWSPNRRRRWGFGVPHKEKSVVTDSPLPHSIIHFAWPFLLPQDRRTMTISCSQWFLYHKLRCYTMFAPIATLKQVRPPPGNPAELPMDGRFFMQVHSSGFISTMVISSGGLAVNTLIAVDTGTTHSTPSGQHDNASHHSNFHLPTILGENESLRKGFR